MTSAFTVAETNRWGGVDLAKGILITLVIFGHTIPTPIPQDPLKWILYGFHMPAFLFISGFLTSRSKLEKYRFWELTNYYGRRLLLPWFLTSIAWQLFKSYQASIPSAKDSLIRLVCIFLIPDYHLWFVPALIFMVFMTWLFAKMRCHFLFLLGFSFIFAIIIPVFYPGYFKFGIIPFLGDEKNLSYMAYFALGYYLRSYSRYSDFLIIKPDFNWLICLSFFFHFFTYIYCFFDKNIWLEAISFFGMNIALMFIFPKFLIGFKARGAFFEKLSFLGRNTLWIYLLHPFITYHLQSLNAKIVELSAALEYPLAFSETLLIILFAYYIFKWQQLRVT